MGSDTKETTSQQSSTTNPWAPATPALQSILGSLGGYNPGLTSGQANALTSLQQAAGSIPDLSGGETNAVTGALNTNTSGQQGLLTDAYGNLQKSLSPIADPNNLNPFATPGFSDALGTLTNDITNQVKGQYAGSGRDPSGAGSFAGSLGRGLMQGEAPVIASQYNSNVGNLLNASNALQSGAQGTASGITNQQLAQLQAQFQGLQGAGALPGLLTAPAQAQLGAANTAQAAPLGNISELEQLVNPIAALGGQSTASGTTDTSQSKSLFSNILGGATGLAGLNGALGSGWLSGLGSSLGSLLAFSDEDLKENIHEVGATHDGQPLYVYNYIGDPEPRVGLLAQDVEKINPENVVEIDGWKAVDYGRQLAPSARIGLLKMAA